ncbi:MAG: Gfo/Idh/MocA family protein, partial [Paracoccaceae bacterium]
MSAPLPLAVLGGGLIGARHALAAHDCAVTRLTAVVEPDADRRAALYAQGYPVVEQIAEVPADTRAAIVATPTQAHHTHTYECLSRGWAVIVEKPIAATLDAARAILDMGGNKGQSTTGSAPVFVGHHRRCHPFVASAQAQIRALGDPVAVQALWALRKDTPYFNADWRRAPGGGPIMINLIHEIDLLQVWLGPIAEVSALVSSARRGHAVEDTAAFALRFDSGAMGSVILSDAGASPWSFEAATG